MKKGFYLFLVLPFVLTFCSSGEQPAVSQTQLPATSAFNYYVATQEALATDDYDQARAALEQLAAESTGELKVLAEEAAQAEDIEGIRAAFKPLSDEVANTDLPRGYVVAFCPMADNSMGANWVQKEGEIRNPYFGSAMLDCGSIIRR
ncbi:DUF3347 domain-containing protein [Acidobacteria bacterium AH-259-D05]|nr:DUF3347 domain-containing protein [Acidobacteria bacterium AH-259-D05]